LSFHLSSCRACCACTTCRCACIQPTTGRWCG